MNYELKTSFKYAKGGDNEDATFLDISSPSNKVIKHVTLIEKQLFKAINNVAKETDEQRGSKDEKVRGEDLIMALASGDANLEKCYEAFKQILTASCSINGDDKFKVEHFERMSYADTKCLLGEYISNFLFTSLAN